MAAIAATGLGADPRATVRRLDATAIDAPDGSFDLAVFALSFHHLAPEAAARVFAEGTRAADVLVIIDLPRPPSPLHLVRLATMLPFAPFVPFVHDGVISSLRCYSPSALRALAAHADPGIDVDLRGGLLSPQVVVAPPGQGLTPPFAVRVFPDDSVASAMWAKSCSTPDPVDEHRREYRRKVQLCLDVFETMLARSSFDFERPLTGMEIECNLVDDEYQPAMTNQEVLAAIADPAYQTELGAYNIEFNVPPRPLPGRAALELESDVRASLNAAESKANRGRRAHRDDRHPADADARAPHRRLDERVDALSGAQRLDLHRAR